MRKCVLPVKNEGTVAFPLFNYQIALISDQLRLLKQNSEALMNNQFLFISNHLLLQHDARHNEFYLNFNLSYSTTGSHSLSLRIELTK